VSIQLRRNGRNGRLYGESRRYLRCNVPTPNPHTDFLCFPRHRLRLAVLSGPQTAPRPITKFSLAPILKRLFEFKTIV
jgi:hypothetical protein